ncbi:MAG: glycosyl hydrolase family 8, partial [Acidimicrobiales bacterium]
MNQRPQTLDRPSGPPPPRRPVVAPRRGAARRITIALAALVAVMGGIAGLALAGAPDHGIPTVSGHAPAAPLALARYDAQSWLTRFMASDGRVIRRDQGGDTVSEGQGYAMLLSVAIGNQKEFDLAWQWDQHYLQLPNKLSSY